MRFFIVILFFISFNSFGQYLDLDKYKEAELFADKGKYDVNERLEEIKEIQDKKVTVYHVNVKNKIKLSYTGIARFASHPSFNDKDRSSLIKVEIKEEDNVRMYFPLTNSKKYRIYLTEKMIE